MAARVVSTVLSASGEEEEEEEEEERERKKEVRRRMVGMVRRERGEMSQEETVHKGKPGLRAFEVEEDDASINVPSCHQVSLPRDAARPV